jgi:lipoprotein
MWKKVSRGFSGFALVGAFSCVLTPHIFAEKTLKVKRLSSSEMHFDFPD